jgi:hypothetical protein
MKKEKDVPNKLSKFLQITEVTSQVLKPPNVHKRSAAAVLYDSETWTPKNKANSESQQQGWNFLQKTAKYTMFDHKRNKDIMKEFKQQPFMKKSMVTNTNGCNMFAEWTDIDSRVL